jgi:hypothetical protein
MLQLISVLGRSPYWGLRRQPVRAGVYVEALLPGRELTGLRGADRRSGHRSAARVHTAGRGVGAGEPVGHRDVPPTSWQLVAQCSLGCVPGCRGCSEADDGSKPKRYLVPSYQSHTGGK